MTEFKSITSRENPLIKLACSLRDSAKARKENNLFILEGLRICTDAAENGIHFEKLIISQTAYNKLNDSITVFAENSDECYLISDDLFKKISDTKSPQGIIAIAKMPDKSNTVINRNGRYVALENLSDPSNLGAVARTAEALGVDGIIVSADSCDPYSPKVLRASMGTILRMPVFIVESFAEEIAGFGLKTFACVVDRDAISITEAGFSNGCAVVIGNEANGISDATKTKAYKKITIPMRGNAESLNAAVAASIAMWEMMK